MLTERQSRILDIVVREHVDTAQPVGSQSITRKYRLGVSSATVRNEMAELEEQGFLGHPHTSAGRVPTEQGYRFYVEWLMGEEELPAEAQETIRHQFHQLEGGQEGWVHLGASILAQVVENAAVVTAPRTTACRLKHLELVSLNDTAALLVLVLDQARLKQQVVSLDAAATQEELSATAAKLNHPVEGLTAHEIAGVAERAAILTPVERQVLDIVESTMRAVDEGSADETYLEGIRHILAQPEFADSARVLELLDLLDQGNLARTIPLHALAQEGVTVIIGADNPRLGSASEAMRECSVILGSYGSQGVASGVIAVLGPMRMRYPRTISTVRYLANVMSDLLAQYYP
ncbi:MAG: heat-inducible transcriptional repressor HrcA [Dehalococcoidia bacterium]